MCRRLLSHTTTSSRWRPCGPMSRRTQSSWSSSLTRTLQAVAHHASTSSTSSTRCSLTTSSVSWHMPMSSGWAQKAQTKKSRQLLSLSSGKRSWKQCLTFQRRVARRSIFWSRAQRRSRLVKSERRSLYLELCRIGRTLSPIHSLIRNRIRNPWSPTLNLWDLAKCFECKRHHQDHLFLDIKRRARVK